MGAMQVARLVAVVAGGVAWATAALSAAPAPPPGASSCSGCHAAKAEVDTAVPRLTGRAAAATVMDRIAKGLTDAEIDAIAAWYAQQK
jgi:sulfide dehydrogenase cytochrome subunit